MGRREAEKNRRRAFAFLMAAMLLAEGTFGSVCAAQEIMPDDTIVSAPAEEEQVPVEEEISESGESEKPAERKEPAQEEAEKPAEEKEPAQEETDVPVEGEKPAQEETDAPVEEEESAQEEADAPAEGEEPAQEEEESTEESVSENTTDAEEDLLSEQIPGAGEALGEPPLMAGQTGGSHSFSYSNTTFATSGESESTTLNTPSTTEIIAWYKEYPWSLDVSNTYSDKPSTTKPYKAGHLSDGSLENALNLLNFIRYVAGVPADVTRSENYTELAQAGALVNSVNGTLSHEPARPSAFTEEYNELYEKGKKGCSSSNIAMGYGNIAKSLLNGWMYDGDSTNIKTMGHRRWVLNPSMKQTGFGAVGAYSAMYAFDGNGKGISDFVAWPAQNMPIELMNGSGTPWTLSLGSNYKAAARGEVKVTLKDVSTAKIWTFSETKTDGYFTVDTAGYGMPNCIIFRPNGVSYNKNSQFQVTVTGLKDKDGNAATVSYSVDFFSLSDTPKEVERVTLDKENLHLLLDDAEGKNQGALHAALTPSNAANKTLTWESLDKAVAIVDQSGVVTAVGVGETTITVTAINGKQAACSVKVSKYVLSADQLEYDKKTDTYKLYFALQGGGSQENAKKLTVKDGEKLSTGAVRWSSENENVVRVDADGLVTPVGVGEAAVWADVENGLKILSCEVKVENAELPTMQMRENTLTMKAGESRQLRVYLSPANTKWGNNGQKYIKWKSDAAGTAVFEIRQADVSGTISENTVSETISGNTVMVKAGVAGTAKITAEIVDEAGQPVEGSSEEKGKAVCEVTVLDSAVLPAEADRPCGIALINTQNTLSDVALPEGWSWKYPDTSLAQFAGQRSKTFPAEYQPTGGKGVQPAETFLSVYFLTVESISARMQHPDEANALQDVSALKSGWTAYCSINYSFEEALEQFEERNTGLKNNTWYTKQRKELYEKLNKSITLTSSKPQTITVEPAKNVEGRMSVSAGTPGEAVLKAELKLGKKTFSVSQKLTVTEDTEYAFAVSEIEHFRTDGDVKSYRFVGELSDFPTGMPKGINSRIVLSMAGTTKIAVKSSNSKVAAVKASAVKSTETGNYEIPLTVSAAGTTLITLTGNDSAKTVRTLMLVVTDACPGLSEETVTVNTWRTVGTDFSLYAAKDAAGVCYSITSVSLRDDEKSGQHSGKFTLTSSANADGSRRNCSITTRSDTKAGTYKVKLHVEAGGKSYDLPFSVKVMSAKPKCSVKQNSKLNLFYQDTRSLLTIDTEETVEDVSLTGCNYLTESSGQKDGYYVKPGSGATLKSVKKGSLKIKLVGWRELTVPFTVAVEKKEIKISPVIGTVTLYPKRGINSARIDIKNAMELPWNDMTIGGISGKAKGNYEAKLEKEAQAILLQGRNLNQADSFRLTIPLRSESWTEAVNLVCNVKVNLKEPAIALEKKTLQLNANEAYKGYDADSTAVRWKNGGDILAEQDVRVSVYCDPKDPGAKTLVADSAVIFTVDKESGAYRVGARLNNKSVAAGNYKYIVQTSSKKDGRIWKTPLTLKIVNTTLDKAVKISAKGSIDVLNREGSFMTLTPSLKAVNGSFVIPQSEDKEQDRKVELRGRDAHLFRAKWDATGTKIELRAKPGETLVTKYKYLVTPVVKMENANGDTEELTLSPVSFQVKQGSVKVTASPKTALMYSGAYNSVEIGMDAVLKGADAPDIEKVTLVGNTDAFTYEYNKEGNGTLTMNRTGRAAKGKNYSLQFRVSFAEQADNVKPVTVKYTVKVK